MPELGQLSRDTNRKLRYLRRAHPDLLGQVQRGALSITKAAQLGGLGEERYSIARDVAKAARTIVKRIEAPDVDELVAALIHHQLAYYEMSIEAYLQALRAALQEDIERRR